MEPVEKFRDGKLNESRERVEVLISRASMLRGRDRVIAMMYLEHGNSYRQMAKLAGCMRRRWAGGLRSWWRSSKRAST